MEWWMFIIIFFGLLIFIFLLGIPIAFGFLVLDIIGLYLLIGAKGIKLIIPSIFDSVANFTLSPILMFILLGEIFYQSRAVDIAFLAIDKWVGGIRARLHIVTLLFATIFGAISGSGLAMAAMMGTTILPEMEKRGYDHKLSLGVVMGGALLDPLIPPSLLAVMVGSLANVSVAKILVSGLGPGFLLAIFFIIYVLVAVKINPKLAPVYLSSTSLGEKIWSLIRLLPFGLIIFLVLGLMMLGIATPTESAATGVIGALILALCLGKLTFQTLKGALWSTVKISGVILLIIAGSKGFSQILALSGATHGMVKFITNVELHPYMVFIMLQIIPLILGCFIDAVASMMILIPIFLPILDLVKFDPLWFWCLFLININLGGITPPFGMVLYTLKATTPKTPLEEIYRAAIPFIIINLLGMLAVIIFPEIAVWLPNTIK
jgi:tripartite ATP-independent transporter DctM subunit